VVDALTKLYEFEYKDMEFSKDGQLDELIALDRYTAPTFDGYGVGDVVVAIVDENMGTKKVGLIEEVLENEEYEMKDRLGEKHKIKKELLQKPLELKPSQLWERWAKGAASVEQTPELQEYWENEFRWLFDGYRYSLGGRIQLMLGQEYVTGEKANLTAYNCFVVRNPEGEDKSAEQFLEVLDVAFKEASIMRRGGGVGLNVSHINTVKGSGRNKSFFKFSLPKDHKDYSELQDRREIGKFDPVTTIDSTKKVINNKHYINPYDSIEGLFEGLNELVIKSYDDSIDEVIVDFSSIRYRNAIVKGVNGRSSGAVSWMELYVLVAQLLQQDTIDNVDFAEIYSHIVHLIIQGGSRRGALMLVCNDDNSNVRKFIERKKTFGYLSGANISVGISDSFMNRVKRAKSQISNGDALDSKVQESLDLWTLIIESAWASAEPGVIFMERYNKESNSWYFHPIIATNP
jgi:ribonucleoside-diphosphate reductase alpha chain